MRLFPRRNLVVCGDPADGDTVVWDAADRQWKKTTPAMSSKAGATVSLEISTPQVLDDVNVPPGAALNIPWDAAYDYEGGTITEMPSDLGLAVTLDGAHPNITATENGTWLFQAQPYVETDDTAIVTCDTGNGLASHEPDVTEATWRRNSGGLTPVVTHNEVRSLEAGDHLTVRVKARNQTAAPYHMPYGYCTITRIS